MDLVSKTYKKFDDIINKDAGIIDSFKIISNSRFIPKELIQTSAYGNNLYPVGCFLNEISSGGIGFSFKNSLYSTLGEFFERYSSGIIKRKENYIFGSYKELNNKYALEEYNSFNLFSEHQYSENTLIFNKITEDTPIYWIKGVNVIDQSEIYCPASFVHSFNFDQKIRLPGTTTGLAAGENNEDIFKGALLECIERHAFSNFWYKQDSIKIIKYRSNLILETFSDNKKLKTLFDNNKVEHIIFDLTHLSFTYTYLCLMYFKVDGKLYYSAGCSSNFDQEIALEKATLEAYKCSEELESILEENIHKESANINDLIKNISNFKDHYWLYNKYPELREQVKIFKESVNSNNFEDKIFEYGSEKIIQDFDITEIKKFIKKIYFFDMTIPDIQKLGFRVGRIITPELTLLSGMADAPFLKYFDGDVGLFTKLPHFFP